MVQCTAKSKRSGKQCERDAMKGKEVCYMHGGKTPRGFDLPQTKTGRHSKYLPTGLLNIYTDSQADPELLSVREDIHLIDALLNFKLQQLLDSDGNRNVSSLKAWETAKKQIVEIRKAYKSENYGALEAGLTVLDELANGAILYYETEREIKDDIERRRKLVETEQKITLQGERAISAESVMLLMAQVLDVIKTVVTDDRQRFAIATGLQSLISVGQSTQEFD